MVSVQTVATWITITFSLLTGYTRSYGWLGYSELQRLNASCSPSDTCAEERLVDSIPLFRCECSSQCVRHNTCCIDAPYIRDMSKKQQQQRGVCQHFQAVDTDVIAVSHCDAKWRGSPLVKSLCENPEASLRDPVSQLPTTNPRSETTYRNYFCAVCNNDAKYLELWEIEISKALLSKNEETATERFFKNEETAKERFLNELVFNEERKQWGVFKDNGSIEEVSITFKVPERLKDIVTTCNHEVVSDCAEGWKDSAVRWMCHSYMALVYLYPNATANKVMTFRNIHCAICNNVTYSSDTVCDSMPLLFERPPMSFTLLLDVNLNDGEKVGEINPCPRGQMYDPFFKKCRTLVCGLPGHKLKNGKCVPS